MTLASLSEAIDWTRDRWSNQRTAPVRLHVRDTEGELGAPMFSPAMRAALDGHADSVVSMTGPTSCYHPLLGRGQPARECPECHGMGVKEHRTDRYLFPMTLALAKLCNSLGSRRQPHPYRLIVALASHGWDAHATATSLDIGWDRAEALFLMAIRKLHGRYSEGPAVTRTSVHSWVDISDSQRAAIADGETAA